MINKDTLIEYVRIISGYDVDPNLTLVDFSLNDEKRKIVNLVNDEAKKDKNLANLLDDLKYSNNKTKVIEDYFNTKECKDNDSEIVSEEGLKQNSVRYGRINVDSYGFINMNILFSIVGIVTVVLTLAVVIWTR